MDPQIIQGGMGIGISSHHLAWTVSVMGHLGTVSGTCVDMVMARNLQLGDPGGHWRRALANFPVPEIAEQVIKRYYQPGGKSVSDSFSGVPMFTLKPRPELIELDICAAFAQVWLAKEFNPHGLVAVNLMTKLPMPLVYTIFGCMLAEVDYILIGAGIPMQLPAVLDALEQLQTATYRLDVAGAGKADSYQISFDPKSIIGERVKELKRPKFVPIITSHILAASMSKRLPGKIDGWIIEGPSAGGHNAPPRGRTEVGPDGQIVYGPRDEPDLVKIRELGLPFWLAGSLVSAEGARQVRTSGAAGIQVGTIFALSDESGLDPAPKQELRRLAYRGKLFVYDDPVASPTGFPFKIAHLENSVSGEERYQQRPRVCNIGHLRQLYLKPDGSIGYRCPAEPVDIYLSKGGREADTVGRKCLCNALAANIGLGQVQKRTGYQEETLVTLGRDYGFIKDLLKSEDDGYSAIDAVEYLEEMFGFQSVF